MDIGETLGKILQVLIVIAIIPTLINSISGIAGINLGGFESVMNVFMSILPLLMFVELIGSLIGERDTFGLKEILNILIIFSVIPQILSAFSGLGIPTQFIDIFNSLLPLLLLIKLIEVFTKALK